MDDIYIMNSTFVGFNCLSTKLSVTGDSAMLSVHDFPYLRSIYLKYHTYNKFQQIQGL